MPSDSKTIVHIFFLHPIQLKYVVILIFLYQKFLYKFLTQRFCLLPLPIIFYIPGIPMKIHHHHLQPTCLGSDPLILSLGPKLSDLPINTIHISYLTNPFPLIYLSAPKCLPITLKLQDPNFLWGPVYSFLKKITRTGAL